MTPISRLLVTTWVSASSNWNFAYSLQWLASKGNKLAWGVGRHILGSQVFDYWYTPDEFMIEHYSDGEPLIFLV